SDVEAVVPVTTTILDDRWCYPTRFAGRQAGTNRSSGGVGWTIYTNEDLLATMRLPMLAGVGPAAGRTDGALVTRSLAEQIFGAVGRAPGSTLVSEQSPPTTILG